MMLIFLECTCDTKKRRPSDTCEAFEYIARTKTCRLHTYFYATLLDENEDADIITYARSSSSATITAPAAGTLDVPIPSISEIASDFSESLVEQIHETYEFVEWNGKLETVWRPTISGKWRYTETGSRVFWIQRRVHTTTHARDSELEPTQRRYV